jgi:hypothetical protein
MTIGWDFAGEQGFEQSVDGLLRFVEEATREAVQRSALLIEANAKASFGPAHEAGTEKTVFDRPQSITGALRRSIEVVESSHRTIRGWEAKVAPQMIYGRRIELGFTGTDSLGRDYDQPPYPYFSPGVEKSLPDMERIFIASWASALRFG